MKRKSTEDKDERKNIPQIQPKGPKGKTSEMKRVRNLFRSTVFRIVFSVIALVLPINIFTLILVEAVVRDNREKVEQELNSSIETSGYYLDSELNRVAKSLIYYSFSNADFAVMEGSMENYTQTQKYAKLQAVSDKLQEIMVNCTLPDLIYYRFPASDYTVVQGAPGIARTTYLEAIAKRETEEADIQPGSRTGTTWKVVVLEGKPFLMSYARWSDAEFGILLNLNWTMKKIRPQEADRIGYVAALDGSCISEISDKELSGELQKTPKAVRTASYFLYGTDLEKYGIRIGEAVPKSYISGAISVATIVLSVLAILFTAISIPILLYNIRHLVVHPLNRLTDAMTEIEKGNLEYRIEERKDSTEFERINHNFNLMMEQVQKLKIDIYETELEKRNVVMQYLGHQIQPHFILNALNILYSYEPEEYELSRKMIMSISKYFRYIVYMNNQFVTLRQEMDFVQNYLDIQKARFPDMFFAIVEYLPELRDALIPPLIVQTIVENSIKHGLKSGKKISIFVITDIKKAGDTEDGEDPGDGAVHAEPAGTENADAGKDRLRIRVADTGEGISEETLEEIRKFRETGQQQPHLGVGIQNTIERLKYIYEENPSISFSRNEDISGTTVEILLPIHFRENALTEGENDEHTAGR
jgi:two-component system sensor histidine kinase YesM